MKKKAIFLTLLLSMVTIFIVYCIIYQRSQDREFIISDSTATFLEQNDFIQIKSDFITDLPGVEEGYIIFIEKSEGLLLVFNQQINEKNIESFINEYSEIKKPFYVIVDNKFVIVVDENNSEAIEILNNL
ncbi:hypothetical protein [Zhenhengia yiwuensis]|uniref:Uncharacterized protein n=1 Tax=Zhenhengia yiwuensis TaxID=2763666 RepID=A0A926IF59_9FIRM|nr:hypothetical protein [Zhenhengia yiwuensis]MBC8581392.1 hypothetical protein [Zhenhengia yiwuensis]